ncbi:MAG TPA: hypothetical protein ENG03_00770 [Thioploca sp.]|nr:MAG: hypothetical protein DRR19_14525 [Gammaproteobacteria bacterium]HDN25633.1 hypothetical protein [Thioploca sp.]
MRSKRAGVQGEPCTKNIKDEGAVLAGVQGEPCTKKLGSDSGVQGEPCTKKWGGRILDDY